MSLQTRARHIIAVTLASFALCAGANEPPPGGEAAFQRADLNKDGRLSKEEASTLPAVAARFEELDKNKDGYLSLEEFMTGYPGRQP